MDISNRVQLRHLRCFAEIAQRGSLARAADALGLTQPAVTKTLQDLERTLGAPLVERGRKGAELTRHGQAFLPRALACLGELDRAVGSVTRSRERSAWTVRVGALPTVAASFVPQALQRFSDTEPDGIVRVVAGPNLYLLSLLSADQLDLVVGRLAAPEHMSGLSFQHLYSEQVRLVVRPGHPLLVDGGFAPARLGDFRVILPDVDAVIRPAVERLLLTLGVGELPRRVESVSTSFGRALVLDTEAVWIISEGVVRRDLVRGDMVALPVDTRDTSGPVGLTVRVDQQDRPGVGRMVAAIRATAVARKT